MAEEVQHYNESSTNDHGSHEHFVPERNEDEQGDSGNVENGQCDAENECCGEDHGDADNEGCGEDHDQAKLMRMSINTAIAIGLHNFPEVCLCICLFVFLFVYVCCFAVSHN